MNMDRSHRPLRRQPRTQGAAIIVAAILLAAMSIAATAAPSAAGEYLERHRAPYRGQIVEYFIHNGLAITDGDIILGTAADMAAARKQMESGVVDKSLTVNRTDVLWPVGPSGAHEVPFVFTAGTQANVNQAVATVNALFTGIIQWVPRTTQGDYVSFNLADQSTNSCASNVGRVGGAQQITGVSTCSGGALMHEMGHAMGLWHIQEDPGQALYLQIHYDTMDPRWRSQYTPRIDSRTIDGYDYGSIMQYGPNVQSVTPDDLTAGSLPFGMDLGQRVTYSAADIDAIQRMYGGARNSVTVATNPVGLDVLVDGTRTTTPAVFNWKLGSLHRLDVPAGLQVKDGFSFAFGRWNHDPAAAPASAQEWIVEAGDGQFAAPADSPKSGALVANFVRLIQVSNTVVNNNLGQFSKVTELPPWTGTTDLYPQGTRFDLTATPNTGFVGSPSTLGAINPMTGTSGPQGVTGGTWRITSNPATANLGWGFGAGPALILAATGNGFDNERIVATVTPPGGTAVGRLIPTILQSSGGGNAVIAPAATITRSDSVQFVLSGIAGLDNPATGSVQVPSGAQANRTVTMHYDKQFQPVLQRVPTCGGSLSLSDSSTWLAYGATVIARTTPVSGAVFAGWAGTLSGRDPSQPFTVDKVPEVTAQFNSIAEALTATAITPVSYTQGQGPVTFTVTGTGFTSSMRVLVDGANPVTTVQLIDSHTLRVTLTDTQFARAGRAAVRVGSFVTANCVADSNDLIVAVQPAVTPQQLTVFEFYNASLNRYFRTAVAAEAAAIRANPATGEQDTGQTFKAWASTAYPDGAKQVCRFYGSISPGPNSHFFTSDVNECRSLQRQELDTPATIKRWNYEEIAFAIKVPASGACPADAPVNVYRVYNNGFALGKDSNHRLTTSVAIYNQMIALGWLPEGVVMCAPA
jgi:hypothetical protein